MSIKEYKTKSCIFDESDGLWSADIDTENSDKCPKAGEDVLLDGSEVTVKGINGYHHNFSIKFSDDGMGYDGEIE